MNTKPSPRKPEDVSPVFGLRYLEEEEAELNGVAGCLAYDQPPIGGDEPTYYTTNCDYQDID
ncbi:MAG TPA: herpeto-tandem family RiPP [Herpetosiphonaceae bacterium]